MSILIGGLIAANSFQYEVYTLNNLVKPLLTIVFGWLCYLLFLEQLRLNLPRAIEQFNHLIGGMSLILILVFWMFQARSAIANYL